MLLPSTHLSTPSTRAPTLASPLATAPPSPYEAPVTTATRPSRSNPCSPAGRSEAIRGSSHQVDENRPVVTKPSSTSTSVSGHRHTGGAEHENRRGRSIERAGALHRGGARPARIERGADGAPPRKPQGGGRGGRTRGLSDHVRGA